MKLAFCLMKYFPYGGQQRDMFRIAETCRKRGHQVDVYTSSWRGDQPNGVRVIPLKLRGFTNHRKRESLAEQLKERVAGQKYHAVVGFIKIPGLDVYYTADSCFAAKAAERSFLYRMGGRCRGYLRMERSIFDPSSKTLILMLSELEKKKYIHHYGTQIDRIHMLPPGISKDRLAPVDPEKVNQDLRRELSIGSDKKIVLMVGSGFKTKGVDRAIHAVSSLAPGLLEQAVLLIVGNDRPRSFQRLARRLGVENQVLFSGGRDDIPRFLTSSDLLIHPAYRENTGTVLIEAMAAGLPVLTTDVCGYSPYVSRADAGMVLPSPFTQDELNKKLSFMLTSDRLVQWGKNGVKYVAQNDVFSLVEKAADIIEQVAAC